MKSKVFCDIRGTYTGKEDRETAILTFIESICQLDDSEELDFSFLSSDTMEFVQKNAAELFNKIGTKTKLNVGTQYSEDISFDGHNYKFVPKSKLQQMIMEIESGNYQKVYYFDDSKINIKMFKNLMPRQFPNIEFKEFLVNGEIHDLNKQLHDFISSKNELNR